MEKGSLDQSNSFPCDNLAVWNHVKPAMFLGSCQDGCGRQNYRMMPSFLASSTANLMPAATRLKKYSGKSRLVGNERRLAVGETKVLLEHLGGATSCIKIDKIISTKIEGPYTQEIKI